MMGPLLEQAVLSVSHAGEQAADLVHPSFPLARADHFPGALDIACRSELDRRFQFGKDLVGLRHPSARFDKLPRVSTGRERDGEQDRQRNGEPRCRAAKQRFHD